MAQQILHHNDGKPLVKPLTRPQRNKGSVAWSRFRKKFLKARINHEGYYSCEFCRGKVKQIDLDHIELRSQRPDLVMDERNIRLLCRPCHTSRHNGVPIHD